MKHASPNILSDLDKLNPDHAAQIREVAGRDTTSTTILGANRPAPVRDWVCKIRPHRTDGQPNFIAPPRTGSTKPPHSWPPPTKFTPQSGIAKKAAIGSMPSRVGPSK
jgi:hypothetical protein